MYRIVKFEMIPFHRAASKTVPSYRQVQPHQFQKLKVVLTACGIYNDKPGSRHYVINESGKEYYEGIWIN